jgi:hypothetical protein
MPDAPRLQPRLEAIIRVPNEESLRALFARPLDFGCRPTVIREPAGGFTVPVIGTAAELERLRRDGIEMTVRELRERPTDVGEGDRFQGGRVAPRGFGRKVGRQGSGPRAS